MDKKLELIKNLAYLDSCFCIVEELEFVEIENAIHRIRETCQSGYKIVSELQKQLELDKP